MRSIRKSPKADEDLDQLELERRQLDERIAQLQKLPKQLELELAEQQTTLPPPDTLGDRERRKRFEEQAARGEIRNERRAQGRSLLMLFLLLSATTAMILWIVALANG